MVRANNLGELLAGSAAWASLLAGLWWRLRVLLSRQLRDCLAEKDKLKEQLSAALTEVVVMRKLVPAGEWAAILNRHGLGVPPDLGVS